MTSITIPIEIELTERSKTLMAALIKASSLQAPAEPVTAPQIGQRWPEHGGIYAGVSRGEGDQPDGHIILLDDRPGKDMAWADAVKWAEGLGNGARLPTRFESALLYANLQDQLETGKWHWTGTQYSDYNAWHQDFSYGDQNYNSKSYEGRCRAVRRLIL